jgi:ferritin-like metal-binding protein YciE
MGSGRLEEIFGQLGIATPTDECEGMKGLIREGEEMITARATLLSGTRD